MDEIFIETSHLILRRFLAADISAGYLRALNDPEIMRYTESKYKRWNMDNVIEYINLSNRDNVSTLIGIFLKEGYVHIGNIRLSNYHLVHKRVDLGVMICDDRQWGKGYAAEALIGLTDYIFKEMKYHKVCADYYSINKLSAKAFDKAGFVIEGVFKDHFIYENKYVDSVRVAKLSPENKPGEGM